MRAVAVGVAAFDEVDPRSSSAASVPASSKVWELLRALRVPDTRPRSAEPVLRRDGSDIHSAGIIAGLAGITVDLDLSDGVEADLSDTSCVPEVTAPFDDGAEGDESDAELPPGSAGSANATAGVSATAIPIPTATANAPTGPMWFAMLIVVPPSMRGTMTTDTGVRFRELELSLL